MLDQFRNFFQLYDLSVPVAYKELPKTTSGNTTYVVDTTRKQYVVRLLVRQGITSVKDELVIQGLLNNAGIITPLYKKSSNGNIAEPLGDALAVISDLILGARQSVDSLELAYDMAATLAKIHDTLSAIHVAFNEQQWFNPKNVGSQLEKYTGPDKLYVIKMTQRYEKILYSNLPTTVTHGDFHTKNIFSSKNRVTAVFDFESAENTVRILDIARLYLTYIKVTDLQPRKVVSTLISGYNSSAESGLSDKELTELSRAFIYVALVTSVSIYNHGNKFSSEKYLTIAKHLIQSFENKTLPLEVF